MVVTVVKEVTFNAAHQLPGYPGKCADLHGHTYKLQVGVTGTPNEQGMVLDFTMLTALIKATVVNSLDHKYLNEVTLKGFPNKQPTAENMVAWIVAQLLEAMPPGRELTFVRLYENPIPPVSYVEWRTWL